jgi:hypothetical protein
MTRLPHLQKLSAAQVGQYGEPAAAPHLPIKGVRVRRGTAGKEIKVRQGYGPTPYELLCNSSSRVPKLDLGSAKLSCSHLW